MTRGADLVVGALAAAGVRHVFTLSGNQILPVYDATIGRDLALVHTRHEAAAVHMADGWARLAEEPGVALAPALERALQSGRPACVDVLIDGVAAPTFTAAASH